MGVGGELIGVLALPIVHATDDAGDAVLRDVVTARFRRIYCRSLKGISKVSDPFPDHPANLSSAPTDLSVLLRPSPPGGPTDLVRVHGGNGFLLWADLPPVLVVGSSGGSGSTTTALGIAAAAAYDYGEHSPIVVDATMTGGDLAARGCDTIDAAGTVQSWLNMSHRSLPSTVIDSCGESSAGCRRAAARPGCVAAQGKLRLGASRSDGGGVPAGVRRGRAGHQPDGRAAAQ